MSTWKKTIQIAVAALTGCLIQPCFGLSEEELNIESLQKIIRSNNVKTVEELIPLLPLELRQNFTLMHDTGSPQGASFQNPRGILFGNTAKTVLTFNGKADQAGNLNIEVMQYNETEKKFEMFDIAFPKDGKGEVHVSSKNPQQCTACHGQNPRPIWQAYPFWKGAYGGFDDEISFKNRIGTSDNLVGTTGPEEAREFQNFKDNMGPRYKALEWGNQTPVSPYYDVKDPKDGTKLDKPANRSADTMPNFRLTKLLNILAADQLIDRVKKSPNFKNYQTSLTALLGCATFGQGIGEAKGRRQKTYQSFVRKFAAAIGLDAGQSGRLRILEKFGLEPRIAEFNHPNEPAKNGYTFDGGSTDPLDSLKTSLLTDLISTDPSFRPLCPSVPSDVEGYDEVAAELYPEPHSPFTKRYAAKVRQCNQNESPTSGLMGKAAMQACDRLIKKANLELASVEKEASCEACGKSIRKSEAEQVKDLSATVLKAADGPEILKKARCIDCHSQGSFGIAPVIPFDDPVQLQAAMKKAKASGHDLIKSVDELTSESAPDKRRMPRGSPALTKDERKAILDYLKSLSD